MFVGINPRVSQDACHDKIYWLFIYSSHINESNVPYNRTSKTIKILLWSNSNMDEVILEDKNVRRDKSLNVNKPKILNLWVLQAKFLNRLRRFVTNTKHFVIWNIKN